MKKQQTKFMFDYDFEEKKSNGPKSPKNWNHLLYKELYYNTSKVVSR